MGTSDDILKRFETLHPRVIDLSLGRTERLLEKLGNPHDKLKCVIHVAGTNGKGSVCAYLSAIFQAAGHRVAVFSSPHLVRFHERIQLAGPDGVTADISEADLVDVLTRTEAANDGCEITFFEITTAAAFLAFAENAPDVTILETGLGGRLDSTNVVRAPAVGVITPVSMDHHEFLGDSLRAIGREKAGILKPGCPGVIAAQPTAAMGAISVYAKEVGAPLSVAGMDWEAYAQHGRLVFQRADTELIDLPLPSLPGAHQVQNAGIAVAAATTPGLPSVSNEALATGIRSATWPARLQKIKDGLLTEILTTDLELWLDGGHNPAAGRVVSQAMAELEDRCSKPLYLICGMMGNKDAAGYLKHFKGLARHVHTVPIVTSEAGFMPADLAEAARSVGLDADVADDVIDALRKLQAQSPIPARVLICGSLYLAGDVLRTNAMEVEA